MKQIKANELTVKLRISGERIADLLTTAIESGDPVTTAARGGWCNGINPEDTVATEGIWYADPNVSARTIVITEVVDERTGEEKVHTVYASDIVKGLETMAVKFPHLFAQIMHDDVDASCADIFLQCIVFGEEKYA